MKLVRHDPSSSLATESTAAPMNALMLAFTIGAGSTITAARTAGTRRAGQRGDAAETVTDHDRPVVPTAAATASTSSANASTS